MPDIYLDVDVALSEVPVNIFPLIDDTDFKTRETAVAYNAAGMDLVWNFITSGGAFTQTAVTPTSGGTYDWSNQGDGFYTIEIPASGGASINNDTEGYGWFSGIATGVLPWRGPIIGFRAAGINDLLLDSAHSTTRGLAGSALPDAAAEAAGGLYTRGTGAGQINQPANGQIDANVAAMGANVITAAATASDFGTEIGTAVWASTTRLLTAGTNIDGSTFTAIPWNTAWDAEVQSEVEDALAAADVATGTDVGSAVTTLQVDIAAVGAFVDTEVGAIKSVTDKLNDTLENDGGTYRFTANALEEGPSGGGGGGDATEANQTIIIDKIDALEVKVDTIDGVVDGIKAKTDNLPSDPADQSILAGKLDSIEGKVDVIDGIVDDILVDTAEIGVNGAGLTAIIDEIDSAEDIALESLILDWTSIAPSSIPEYCSLQAQRFLRNSWDTTTAPGKVTIFDEFGNIAWQRNINTDPAAEPIVGTGAP